MTPSVEVVSPVTGHALATIRRSRVKDDMDTSWLVRS